MEEIRVYIELIMCHTTIYYENDAIKCRIKGPCDYISLKTPLERSHDGEVFSCILLTS